MFRFTSSSKRRILWASSKKGISAHSFTAEGPIRDGVVHGPSPREAIRIGSLDPMGGEGKIIETDETYIGRLEGQSLDERKHPTQYRNHKAQEYVRDGVTTNSLKGYFSIFERGMKGIYQHCSEKHLHRYLAEFDFGYSNRVRLFVDDERRTQRALRGIVGKRLTYQDSSVARE